VIVAYVSGHGFGHATRTAEVLAALRRRRPDVPLAVVTSGDEALYRRGVPGALIFRKLVCDVGLVQAGALVIDEESTAASLEAFALAYPGLLEEESSWLRSLGASVVLGDVPPLAFDAAAAAGIPSVALANFSWDWVYRHLQDRGAPFLRAATQAAEAYSRTTLLLRLPFACDLRSFPRAVDIPLVARHPKLDGSEVRKRLGLPDGTLVLLSFGGIGLSLDLWKLEPLEFRFVQVGSGVAGPRNVFLVAPSRLDSAGVRYEDLVGTCEVVVTKPGYGIVSDAIAARTRVVYTERGDFPEYPILVREMPRYLPCAHVSNDDLLEGRLGTALRVVMDQVFPSVPDLSGADVAAQRILEVHK